MNHLPDAQPLTQFRENTAKQVKRLRTSHRPLLLTQNGRAACVVMSPQAYEDLLDEAELARSIRRVEESIDQFAKGRGLDARTALSAWKAKQKSLNRRAR